MADGPRYVAVMFLRPDDDRRRWLVVDLRPWESKRGATPGKAGTVVADVMGEGNAVRIADALNGQPTIDDAEAELAAHPLIEVPHPITAADRPLVDPAYPAGGRVPPPPTGEPDADGVPQAY